MNDDADTEDLATWAEQRLPAAFRAIARGGLSQPLGVARMLFELGRQYERERTPAVDEPVLVLGIGGRVIGRTRGKGTG